MNVLRWLHGTRATRTSQATANLSLRCASLRCTCLRACAKRDAYTHVSPSFPRSPPCFYFLLLLNNTRLDIGDLLSHPSVLLYLVNFFSVSFLFFFFLLNLFILSVSFFFLSFFFFFFFFLVSTFSLLRSFKLVYSLSPLAQEAPSQRAASENSSIVITTVHGNAATDTYERVSTVNERHGQRDGREALISQAF